MVKCKVLENLKNLNLLLSFAPHKMDFLNLTVDISWAWMLGYIFLGFDVGEPLYLFALAWLAR